MTNEEIIYKNSVALVAQGKLHMVETAMGLMPEPIHTFNGWKERGYRVKKGEKSFIKFSIWKCATKTVKVDDEEEETSSMFTKTAAFFTFAQVEPINS